MYSTMFQALDAKYSQEAYIPIKWDREPKFDIKLNDGHVKFSQIIKPIHKFLYFNKVSTLYNDVVKKYDIDNFDIIHAHSIFADGGVAYKLHKKFNKEYVITVRMTDIALQYKKMIHRRSFANKVLLNAKKIIFVSDIYRDELYSYVPKDIVRKLNDKTIILPNGVNDIYLQQTPNITQLKNDESLKLLHIGRFVQYKNLDNVIEAVKSLKATMNIELTIIGGESNSEVDYSQKVINSIDGVDFIKRITETYDKSVLIDLFSKNHMFICPSTNELFGVVFIEAMSQNTPFIYGVKNGVEPFVKGNDFCEKVDGLDIESIKNGILNLKKRYDQIKPFGYRAKEFAWDKIITTLSNIYNE